METLDNERMAILRNFPVLWPVAMATCYLKKTSITGWANKLMTCSCFAKVSIARTLKVPVETTRDNILVEKVTIAGPSG